MEQIKNNKGSTLLMVLIMTAVLTILGTALLSMSFMNLNMKYNNEKIKKATYYSESGIDQVYAYVGKRVEDSLDSAMKETDSFRRALIAYLNETAVPIETIEDEIIVITYRDDIGTVINNTTIKDPNDSNKSFTLTNGIRDGADYVQFFIKDDINGIDYKDKIIDTKKLSEVLDKQYTIFFTKDFDDKSIDLIEKIEGLSGITNGTPCIIDVKDEVLKKFDTINESFIIKDISSTFTYNQQAVKTITTNLIINKPKGLYPYALVVDRIIIEDNPIWQNALVSNNDIIFRGTGAKGIKIIGDVYAFGTLNNGLNLEKNAKVSITGDVISRYNIQTVGENAVLNINHGLIYCDSLMTSPYAKNSSIITNNSNVHTKDDIELNGEGSNINILKGSYYGISDGDSSKTHDDSSAIIINAKLKDTNSPDGASIQIDGENPNLKPGFSIYKEKYNFLESGVWIPGTAYVNVEGEDIIDEDGKKIVWPYQTGESVSIKGNYIAYTMPLNEPSEPNKELFNFVNLIIKTANNNVPFIIGYDPSLTSEPSSLKFQYFNVEDKKSYFMEVHRENPNLLDFGSSNSLVIKNYEHALGINIIDDGTVIKDKFDFPRFDPIKHMSRYNHIYYLLNGNNYENPVDRKLSLIYPDDFSNELYKGDYPEKFDLINKMVYDNISSSVLRDISNTYVKNYIFDTDITQEQKKATEIIFASNPELNNIRIIGEGASGTTLENEKILTTKSGADIGYFQGIIITQGKVIIDGKVNFAGSIIAGGNIEIINGEGSEFHNSESVTVMYMAELIRNNPELRNILKKGSQPKLIEFNKQNHITEASDSNIKTNYKNLLQFNQWRIN